MVSHCTWVWYASGFSLHVGMVCEWFLIGSGKGMLVDVFIHTENNRVTGTI